MSDAPIFDDFPSDEDFEPTPTNLKQDADATVPIFDVVTEHVAEIRGYFKRVLMNDSAEFMLTIGVPRQDMEKGDQGEDMLAITSLSGVMVRITFERDRRVPREAAE